LKAELRKHAERKARKMSATIAKELMIKAQDRQEPGIMAFGGDGPFFGN
jgi:hypothetical protein